MISQKLSDSLRVANLFCTILVVAIHYNTKHDMDLSLGYTWNYYIQEFLTNGIARIAVPFFAFIAGFFLFLSYKNNSSYPIAIQKRVKRLFVPYILASSIIFIIEYLYGKVILDYSLGTFNQLATIIILKPVSVHFWFLRDLMFLVLITPLIFLLVKHLKLLVIVLVMTLWFFDIELMPLLTGRYFITIETLSFFTLGCYCAQNTHLLERLVTGISNKVLLGIVGFYLFMCIVRIILEPDMANWYTDKYQLHTLIIQNISIFIGVFLVVSLSSKAIHQKFLYLSQFTFFVYIFHLLPLSHLVGKITSYMISDAHKFYLTFPLATLLVFITAYFVKEKTPIVYKILSGNR